MRRIALAVTLIAILGSTAAGLAASTFFISVFCILGLIGVLLQDRAGGAYARTFGPKDWKQISDGHFEIRIPRHVHWKKDPRTWFSFPDDTLAAFGGFDYEHLPDDTIVLKSTDPNYVVRLILEDG